jgi:hypothetical protein
VPEAAAAGCALVDGHCLQQLDDASVGLRISPPEIPLMQTLNLTVDSQGLDADGVTVEIRGLNMDMGLNRVSLAGADGRWTGQTILPICSQRRMEWEARVLIDGPRKLAVPFLFSTRRFD